GHGALPDVVEGAPPGDHAAARSLGRGRERGDDEGCREGEDPEPGLHTASMTAATNGHKVRVGTPGPKLAPVEEQPPCGTVVRQPPALNERVDRLPRHAQVLRRAIRIEEPVVSAIHVLDHAGRPPPRSPANRARRSCQTSVDPAALWR